MYRADWDTWGTSPSGCPESMRHSPDIGEMSAHRLRCWPKIVPTLVERIFSMQMSDSSLNPKPLGVPPSLLCVVQVIRQVFAYGKNQTIYSRPRYPPPPHTHTPESF